ncbi:MAG: helix-turn-helix domain-containing protein [Verrucomicrobia bacterium]|nr:MAG: helix-turn-helix domain-containing protein [Verrucomicrobiota bacterium]
MPHKTFNLDEVARYLHLNADEVQRYVRERVIPHEERGGRLVFKRSEIDAWASRRILGASEKRLKTYHRQSSERVLDFSKQHAIVPELLHADFIEPALTSRTKASVIRDMVKLAERTDLVNDATDLLKSLEERERLCTTALPGSVALLHPHTHDAYRFSDSFIVFGRAIQPLPFGSPDGSTTDLFFLVCCQNDRLHLHVLARICMMCHHTDLLLNLREAGDATALFNALIAAEQEVVRQM